jgi:hypothetical protein
MKRDLNNHVHFGSLVHHPALVKLSNTFQPEAEVYYFRPIATEYYVFVTCSRYCA